MGSLTRERAFLVALVVSISLHVGFGAALGVDRFTRLLQPQPVLAVPPPPPSVQFELVDTPQSAATDAPPQDSRFISNRNTRAQDQTPPDNPEARDRPNLPDLGESHDVRHLARAPAVGVPSPVLVPAPQPAQPQALPELHPAEPKPPAAEKRYIPLEPPRPDPPADVEPTPHPAPQPAPEPPPAERTPTQPTPAAVRISAPAPDPKHDPRPESAPPKPAPPRPAVAPPAPPQPTPEIQQLPKKAPTQQHRELERLRRDLAALRPDEAMVAGNASLSATEAEELANARIQGEFSYGATQHFFGDYLLEVKEQVERQWISRLLTEYAGLLHSKVVVDFKIFPHGNVGAMRIVQTRGDDYFPVLCVLSIKDASPFSPVPYATVEGIPTDLAGKPLNIRFTFQYN